MGFYQLYGYTLQTIPNRTVQMAEMILMTGNIEEAENLLLQNGLVFRAIMANIHLHNWSRFCKLYLFENKAIHYSFIMPTYFHPFHFYRALDISTKHRTHIDTVLFSRNQYLEALQKSETNDKFLALKDEVSDLL